MEANFHEYDGGLLKLEKAEYMEMYEQEKLLDHLERLDSTLKLELRLAEVRN